MNAEVTMANIRKSKLLMLIMSIMMLVVMAGCGGGNAAPQQKERKPVAQAQEKTATPEVKHKSLVVYFSVPETTKADNMNAEEEYSTVVINGKVLGNTQYVAQLIQEKTGGDIFRIEPVTPYPMNHDELEKVATQEQRENALPKIAGKIENLDKYDTVFVGYPNWYADMPRIMYSFFETYDLSGKTLIPFVTSGGSGFSGTIGTIKKLEPNAKVVEKGLAIWRNNAENAKKDVVKWLDGLGY